MIILSGTGSSPLSRLALLPWLLIWRDCVTLSRTNMFSPTQPARTDMAVTATTAYWSGAFTLPDPGLVHEHRARPEQEIPCVCAHVCRVNGPHKFRPFRIRVMLMLQAWDLSLISCRSCEASFIVNYLFVCILVPIWSDHAFRAHCPILKNLFISVAPIKLSQEMMELKNYWDLLLVLSSCMA